MEGQEYFAGKNLTIADISILASVSSFEVSFDFGYIYESLNELIYFQECGYDLSPYPDLKKWYERLHSMPSFDECLKGAKVFADLMRKCYEDQLF